MPVVPVLPSVVGEDVETLLAGEPSADRTVFLARLERHWPDLLAALEAVYAEAAPEAARTAVSTATRHFVQRSHELRMLDLRRIVSPDWFQRPSMLGYAAYTENFGGTLKGIADKVPYLAELGVTYLHLLPLLKPRPKPNDGGYAVMDYRTVREDLGTMEDLADLARLLRAAGISLAIDLVLNHVAREHEWARRARGGEERYRNYFHCFPDRTTPDEYERSLPEVFPDFAPGNFTWDTEMHAWVWTTFNSWQWDLNWSNPDVFHEFADLVCFLANVGVECLRLDAIAFVWKRMGTSCQNQPEVHHITQALRSVLRIAAPAVLFKAEAIVGPQDLMQYLGSGRHSGRVSDLAYHNSFMVQMWSGMAARDARLATVALRRFTGKPNRTAWATYIRCHDDIGWAIGDDDAAAVGWNGHAHRTFLADYYSGQFWGSPARGLVFQHNPHTGDRRISGSAASLLGVEAALQSGNTTALDLALRRLLLMHTAMLGFGGIPLVWMGDEIGLLNDSDWAENPEHADDNRWAHRPKMPWETAERRLKTGTVEHTIYSALQSAAWIRAGLPAMHAEIESVLLDPVNPAILAWLRPHPTHPVVALHNLSEHVQAWPRSAVPMDGALVDALTGEAPRSSEYEIQMAPYEPLWLVGAS